MVEPSKLEQLPVTYGAISEYVEQSAGEHLYPLRQETLARIERVTHRPLLCYVTKTHGIPPNVFIPTYIDDGDLTGFSDLVHSTEGDDVDILLVSDGGSAEASERIVRLLRERFKTIRFIVPANAYSAATLICFSGDEIIMDSRGTLGPIDPQYGGIPARSILKAFEKIEGDLEVKGPRALTVYMPLIEKYDLHLLEMCRSAEELSKELARNCLSDYMLKCGAQDERVTRIVNFFSDYDLHKSHARGIYRSKARELGLNITDIEDLGDVSELVRSLYNQHEVFFDKTPFYKLYENTRGVAWGRQDIEANKAILASQPTA